METDDDNNNRKTYDRRIISTPNKACTRLLPPGRDYRHSCCGEKKTKFPVQMAGNCAIIISTQAVWQFGMGSGEWTGSINSRLKPPQRSADRIISQFRGLKTSKKRDHFEDQIVPVEWDDILWERLVRLLMINTGINNQFKLYF
jgi:hypothetical protein